MSDIVLPLLQIGATTLLLGLLFAAAGGAVYSRTIPDIDGSEAIYRWAASFFLGMFLYLFLFRGFALLIGSARAACALSLLILVGFAVSQRRTISLRLVVLMLAGFAVFVVFNGLRYLIPVEHLDIYTSLGSLHGGRYSNVGLYVVTEDQVPRLTQNYGQSLLVGTQLLLGSPAPLATLASWLALSQAMFALMLLGFFRGWGLNALAIGLGVFLVLFCNVALSVNYIYLIDSGSPIAYTGYTDTTAALATWLMFLDWLRGWDRDGERRAGHLLLPALLACGWTITGPQNFIIGGAVVGALGLLHRNGFVRHLAVGVVLVAAFALGSVQGGMFLPKPWATDTGLPGIMTVQASGETALMPELAFAFREDGSLHWWFQLHSERFPKNWFYLETHLWIALRILFFPIAGIVGLAALRGLPESARLDRGSRDFWLRAAFASFFPGFLASFWFIFHGYKWELGRFLLPGILTGLIGLVLAVNDIAERFPRLGGWLWGTLLVLGTVGPLTQVGEGVIRNHLAPYARDVSYGTRLKVLLTPERIPERYPPHEPMRPLDPDSRPSD